MKLPLFLLGVVSAFAIGREFKPFEKLDPQAQVDRVATGRGRVILYTTSWCPACREARIYLVRRGIRFEERNIEADPPAARELAAKRRRARLGGDRVPVLDVDGDLVVGFDVRRYTALLHGYAE